VQGRRRAPHLRLQVCSLPPAPTPRRLCGPRGCDDDHHSADPTATASTTVVLHGGNDDYGGARPDHSGQQFSLSLTQPQLPSSPCRPADAPLSHSLNSLSLSLAGLRTATAPSGRRSGRGGSGLRLAPRLRGVTGGGCRIRVHPEGGPFTSFQALEAGRSPPFLGGSRPLLHHLTCSHSDLAPAQPPGYFSA
jgi:hypothetical protein